MDKIESGSERKVRVLMAVIMVMIIAMTKVVARFEEDMISVIHQHHYLNQQLYHHHPSPHLI